tara:strand:- start:250 stop:852 length:603 start_codon:yes stop_codon:yes gene_type:complete
MEIKHVFALPVFLDKAEGSEYTDLQEELTTIKSKLNFNDRGIHMILNENPFESNFLIEHGCHHSINFINKTVNKFITFLYGENKFDSLMIIESWMTKTIKGRCAREHCHGAADISGVYYLDTNSKDGNLVFTNPNNNLLCNKLVSDLVAKDIQLPLENGLIALWPAQLKHRTEENKTDHERVSVSFNITLSKKRFGIPTI